MFSVGRYKRFVSYFISHSMLLVLLSYQLPVAASAHSSTAGFRAVSSSYKCSHLLWGNGCSKMGVANTGLCHCDVCIYNTLCKAAFLLLTLSCKYPSMLLKLFKNFVLCNTLRHFLNTKAMIGQCKQLGRSKTEKHKGW